MAEDVTLLDLSFNTAEAVDGLDALIKKSLELSDEKKQLVKQINAEKLALAGIRQNYKDNLLDQTAFEKQSEKSEKAIIALTKQLNNNKIATSENAAQIKAHTTIVNSEAESVETLRAQLALNTKALNKMSVEQRTNTESGKQMVAQTKEISDRLKELEKGVGDTRRNVGNYAEDIEAATANLGGMTGATGQMIKGMTGGIASIKAFNAALMANPFVAIASAILAVISAIGKLMDRNNELAVSVKTILAPIELIITRVLDAVAALFTEIVKVFEWLAEAYIKVYNWLGLISDETVKSIETARGMAQVQRDIYNAETDNVLVLARQRRELEKMKTIVAEQTKSLQERTEAADRGVEILRQMEEAELGVLRAKYEQIKAQNALSYTSDEDRRKEVEALAALEQKQAEYEAQRRELIGQRSGFENTERANAAAADKKRAEDYAKAQKEAAEKAKKAKEDADKKAAETAKRVQQEVLKSYETGITELQLRIRERNIGIVDKRRSLEDQNELNQAILEKERYRLEQGLITQAEFDNIRYEQQVAFQEKVAAIEAEEEAKRKEAKAMDLENQRAIEEENITSDFERETLRLEQQYQMEVAAAEKVGADVTLIEAKYAQIREKREKELVNAKLQMTADIAGQISNIMGQESAAGKVFALAQATINTYLGASKAIAQGGIWGVAQAAIVIAAGLKQVASIAKVKEDVPKTNTSVRKYAKGGQIFGPSHSQGGVTFVGSNGQRFEAEGGENMYILNRKASSAINALSALNMQYGGRSFGGSNVYKYADGGGFDVLSAQSLTNLNKAVKKDVDLSPKTIAAIALAFVDGVQNAPNPVVSVQDITDVQQGRTLVIDSATN
uniref:Tail length tape measure protein n=1 Tax=Siphoviridae sp. ctt0c4 TaxID=2825702 RepID=A0A8S5V374_9CAUD|nr:MAG TPA: tail length tape measure protein [Siphoviridae sp. ctt0c4]